MSCIGFPRDADRELHDHCARKLLIPGWAGEVDDSEAVYIAGELTRRPELRRFWEVARFTRQRKKITGPIAKRLCAWWAQRSTEGVVPQNSNTGAEGGKQNMTESSGNGQQLLFPVG